ncbi:MAG: substrate-binding domain-containing protein [Desulfitobacteriaceae bacterium]
MSQDPPLTVEETAQLLKISKYTLYELIKRGEIPAQRIGRQLRIDPGALNKYLFATEPSKLSPYSSEDPIPQPPKEIQVLPEHSNLSFAGSHEPTVELLQEFLKHSLSPVQIFLSFTGSMEGLIALYRREATIVGVHLWDPGAQEYNIPFVQHVLPGDSVVLINLVQRTQGWITLSGNPLNLVSWADITKDGLRFINRQKGSGTRLRLDSYLHSAQIPAQSIQGYAEEESTHFGVAYRVANGEADAGLGVRAAAQRLGLDFIPLFKERYDIVCLKETFLTPAYQQLLITLQSPAFHKAINQQVGYDTSLTGQIMYQSD